MPNLNDILKETDERFGEFLTYITNEKNWKNGKPVWKGHVYVTVGNAIMDFYHSEIKRIVSEIERERRYNPSLDEKAGGLYFTLGKIMFYDDQLTREIQNSDNDFEKEKMIWRRMENQKFIRMILDQLKDAIWPKDMIQQIIEKSNENINSFLKK